MTQTDTNAASRHIEFRAPTAQDGAGVWELIAASGALDENSLYCNLLQCTDFARTCVVAERAGRIVGWMSAYIPPQRPGSLFVWQICVDPAARGNGLAQRMVQHVLDREDCPEIAYLECTITKANDASWALFRSLARRIDAPLSSRPHFQRHAHLNDRHDCEHLVSIGPLGNAAKAAA